MTRLPRLGAAQVLKALQRDGWLQVRASGGHSQLKHPSKQGRVTVPVHAGRTLSPDLLASILRQAGLTTDEFTKLL